MADMLPLQAPTLAGAALPAISGPRAALLRNVALAVAGSLLLILSAKIKVPFWPVPMTMQTFAVLGIGAAYGSRLGMATVLLYLAYGLAGLPVFTNTPPVVAGPLYFVGPTGGFLFSFVVAAAIAGWSAGRGASVVRMVGGLIVANFAILAIGAAWLALGAQMASGVTGIGFAKAWAVGVEPFLLGNAVKLALVACFVQAGWTMIARRA